MVMELRNERPHERVIVLDETSLGRDEDDDGVFFFLSLSVITLKTKIK